MTHPLSRFPPAMAAIDGVEPLPLIATKVGVPTARVHEKFLHSSYDPIREGEKFVSLLTIDPGAKVFLYGVGLGYTLPPLLNAIGPTGQLVVAEPNRAALATAATLLDPTIWGDPRLTLVAAATEKTFLAELSDAFNSLGDQVTVALWPPSVATAPADWQGVRTAVEMLRMERRYTFVMGDAAETNHDANLPRLLGERGIATLAGLLNGAMTFVIGAGPSLDRDIVHLAAYRERAFLIASDTAFPALLAEGIEPDLVVSVDPKPATLGHFELAGRWDLPLVVLPTVAAALVARWEGPLFVGFRGEERYPAEDAAWLRDEAGLIAAGGSVSAMALELALTMGAGSVVTVGQDFGYPGGRVYASGTVIGRFHQNWAPTDDLRTDHDIFGRPLLSTLNLYSYRRIFEEIAATASVPLYTLSMYAPPMERFMPVAAPPVVAPPAPVIDWSRLPRLAAPPVPLIGR